VIRFALKGLGSRKLRSTLTVLAIVLGVAMVSGTYVLTDSIDKAFDAIIDEIYRNTDASITGKTPFDLSGGSGSEAPSFDEGLLDEVLALDEVEDAIGGVANESTQLIGKDDKAVVYGGAPNLGFSVDPTRPQFNTLTLVEGQWPGDGELVVDTSTAGKEGFDVGDTVGVQAEDRVVRLRLSGLVTFGAVETIGGATLAGFDLATAQRLFAKEGRLDQIRIAGRDGVSPEALVAAVEKILPPGTQVRTGVEQAAEDASETNEALSFLQKFLLAFAGVALFVGAFVIANSLSITIAQRTREFATLRTIGASRRQLLGTVVIEALVVGTIASVAGLLFGLVLATGLFELFDVVGFTLPNSGLVFYGRTIVVALVVGVVVTLVASLRPALRATRVPPIAAVREGATLPEGRFHRFRTPAALLTIALGFGLLLWGLFGADGTTPILLFMLVGALVLFIGVALFSVRLVRPLSWALGWPATRIGGAAGALARDNARRNPQRTSSTAAALMIGLALVTLVSVLAAGIVQTFTGAVEDLWQDADYAITAQNNFSPIPIAAAEAVAATDGVEFVANVRTGEALVLGHAEFVTAVDPPAAKVFSLDWVEGSNEVLGTLGEDGAFVDDGYAKDNDLTLGSPVELVSPSLESRTFVVKGIFDPPTGGSPFGRVTISAETWDALVEQPRNLFSFVLMEGGQTDANAAALDRTLGDFPNAKAQTRDEFVDNQISGLSAVLNILYVLLALSVVVSLFGIVNTLVLTVFERTREIGMLRAIGMTRRQVRRMIRHESVITALIGAVIGIVLGVILAGLLIARVDFIDFTLPAAQLVVFAIASVFVGIVAAIFPARRAARLDPLQALHYE
jgi:putative ABC transport system permease protein